MSKLDTEVFNRCCAILRGGAEAAKYADFYREKECENRNNYSGRFNPNLTNKSSSGSIGKGNINISSISSMSRTGPNLSGYGIY
jgi:hypothetical protein